MSRFGSISRFALIFAGLSALALYSADLASAPVASANPAREERVVRGVTFVEHEGVALQLDLYLPLTVNETPRPLLVWIHGGGFKEGSRRFCPIAPLTQDGYAVASISYRLSGVARFPAQIEDAKSAIRWLRAHAADYGYDGRRIGVCGESAGGLLAALLGTAPVVPAWGDGLQKVSSAVQAVVGLCPPTDIRFDEQELARIGRLLRSEHPTEVEIGKVMQSGVNLIEAALGGALGERRELAAQMSPLSHVSADDPPFLLVHGDRDVLVPMEHSEKLRAALATVEVPCELIVVKGAGHGFGRPKPELMARIKTFFDERL
jgi:acetyl esterase/lipase